MYADDFEYNGQLLSESFLSMICTFNGNGLETVSAGADIEFNQVAPLGRNEFDIYSSKYSQPYSTKFQICLKPCNDAHTDTYSVAIGNSLKKWLCSKKYCKFKLVGNPEFSNIYWNATFSVQELVYNGKCVGFELTMYTNAPYAFYEDDVKTYNCTEGNHRFIFQDISNEEQTVHADFKIKFLQDVDEFILTNDMSTKVMRIKNCKNGEIITIDGKREIITSNMSSHNLGRDFNYMFPEISNNYYYINNIFTVNADCEITITHRPIAKVGIGG